MTPRVSPSCGAGWQPAADPKGVPRQPAFRLRCVGQVFNLRPVSNRPGERSSPARAISRPRMSRTSLMLWLRLAAMWYRRFRLSARPLPRFFHGSAGPRPARAAHPAGPQAADPVSVFAHGPPAPRTLPVPKLRTRSPSSPAAPQVMWVGEGLYAGVPRFEIARVDRSRHGDLALHRMESAPFPACSGEFPIESRNSMNLQ